VVLVLARLVLPVLPESRVSVYRPVTLPVARAQATPSAAMAGQPAAANGGATAREITKLNWRGLLGWGWLGGAVLLGGMLAVSLKI
jgi:hypothetical protein